MFLDVALDAVYNSVTSSLRPVSRAAAIVQRDVAPQPETVNPEASLLADTASQPSSTGSKSNAMNVSFIVIPAVLIPIVIASLSIWLYFFYRRRRMERHRREVKELTTRPFSRLMTFAPPPPPPGPPKPPTIILDIRRSSKYASTIPVGPVSAAPSSPTSRRTSFAEPPTPSGRSIAMSTVAGTNRGSVDSKYWPAEVSQVPPVPELPQNVKMKFAIKGVESRPPSQPPSPQSTVHTLGGSTLRDSVDSRRWSMFSTTNAPPVPQLPPLSAMALPEMATVSQQDLLTVPRAGRALPQLRIDTGAVRASSVPPQIALATHTPVIIPKPPQAAASVSPAAPLPVPRKSSPAPRLPPTASVTPIATSPRLVDVRKSTTPNRSKPRVNVPPPVITTATNTLDGFVISTALTPAPAPPATVPKRKRGTVLMERRQRRLNLALADALVSPPPTLTPEPQPQPPASTGARRESTSVSSPLPPPPKRRPVGPRTLSYSSMSSGRSSSSHD
ncbi:hypothetical protein EXIGLDRAFT_843483 [Exidia glandulosa HHB12029]|uniref:Uncharacterized protein n=1 Tax=Exidia glandulosa HHB12029 TaxID=1314781 RepID=A0A165CM36_EXIGL|nr:hypothetical protein EXIGLDRAFT_843483 [Exidia glandulosa HHB12029]